MTYSIHGHVEKFDVYVILRCPLDAHIWSSCPLAESLRLARFCSLKDCIDGARKHLDDDLLADFIVVRWECRNVRNRLVSNKLEKNLNIPDK